MKGKQSALFPGTEDRVGYWITPTDLMEKLQKEFDFNFDACPYPRPAGFDGLVESWGSRTWINPPFWNSRLTAWSKKAVKEMRKGKLVVMVKPVSPHDIPLFQARAEIRVLGRVPWIDPEGHRIPRSGLYALFILRPYTSGPHEVTK